MTWEDFRQRHYVYIQGTGVNEEFIRQIYHWATLESFIDVMNLVVAKNNQEREDANDLQNHRG